MLGTKSRSDAAASEATVKEKAVIGALADRAGPDHKARKVILSYTPGLNYKTLRKNIKKFDSEHQEATALFLGIKVRGEENKKLYKNLDVLSDRIILKVEALFEIKCEDCDETYCNTLDSNPLHTCRTCLQGSHDCEKVTQRAAAYEEIPLALRLNGMSWMCYECHRKNDLSLPPSTQPVSSSQAEEVETEEVEVVDGEKGEEEERESPSRRKSEKDPPKPEDTEICTDFRTSRCRHGISGKKLVDGNPCPKLHPRPCRRFLNNGLGPGGCKKGKKCKFFHPNICRGSLHTRVCPNLGDCPYMHLKPTFKQAPEDKPSANNRPVTFSPDAPLPAHLQRTIRFDSVASLPYVPTIDQKRRHNQQSDATSTSDFLYKLMESMKEGIISQVSEQLAEFKTSIPNLVRDHSAKESARTLPSGMNMTQGVPLIRPYPSQIPGHPPYAGYCY